MITPTKLAEIKRKIETHIITIKKRIAESVERLHGCQTVKQLLFDGEDAVEEECNLCENKYDCEFFKSFHPIPVTDQEEHIYLYQKFRFLKILKELAELLN